MVKVEFEGPDLSFTQSLWSRWCECCDMLSACFSHMDFGLDTAVTNAARLGQLESPLLCPEIPCAMLKRAKRMAAEQAICEKA